MVKPRKAATALAAREKARARAEEITRRNEELIELATGYFVATDRIDTIEAELEEKVAALREQADRDTSTAREKAAGVVAAMLSTGGPKRGVAERLGISAAEVSAAQKSATLANGSDPVGEPSAGEVVDHG